MLNCGLLCASNATIRASNARKSDKVTITESSAASDRLYVHMSAMQTILKIVFIVIMLRLRSVHAVAYKESLEKDGSYDNVRNAPWRIVQSYGLHVQL